MAKRRRGKPSQRDNIKDRDRLTDTGGLSKADKEADSRDRRDCFKSQHNDPAWYAQNPQLMRDYASFPFGTPIGITLPSTLGIADGSTIPGLMALYYAPTIGTAQVETDPINIAARNIYSFVRHANSGHSNYDSPDLMLYLIAMDSVYMFHSYMKRLLGLVLDYSPLNRYYPAALIAAMGVDPDDLRAHIADFRGFINQYAVQVGSMCVPNSMSYMARHTWMTEGVYTDSMAAKAQSYVYVPASYYKFKAIQSGDVAVGSLERVTFFDPGTYTKKVSDIIAFAQSLLTPIITNEDLNIMSGDILKAFGAEGVVKISGVLDGYMVLPVYSQEVLSQIENSIILSNVTTPPTGSVTQNTAVGGGYLKADDVWAGPSLTGIGPKLPAGMLAPLTGDKLLNFHHDNVTPEEVMVATRLTPGVNYNATTGVISIDSCGSEVVFCAAIWSYKTTSGVQNLKVDMISTCWMGTVNAGLSLTSPLNSIVKLSDFDWAPAVVLLQALTESGKVTNFNITEGTLQDVDNYTVLSKDNLRNLHLTAMLSEFSVPQMGSFSNKA